MALKAVFRWQHVPPWLSIVFAKRSAKDELLAEASLAAQYGPAGSVACDNRRKPRG